MMKRFFKISFASILAIGLLASCGSKGYEYYGGEVRGSVNRPSWENVQPFGMVYIPSGTYRAGLSDQDINGSMWQKQKVITVQGFYMDETEITNNEYRQFVNWVRDSLAHLKLAEDYEEHKIVTELPSGEEVEQINWATPIEWDSEDPDYQLKLAELNISAENQLWGRKQLDVSQLMYQYEWFDYMESTKTNNRQKPRSEFLRTKAPINIYPDTLVWIDDFSYSYNEPMARQYFSHPSFDAYPVVGVNWDQAKAFSVWRTRFYNDYRMTEELYEVDPFRLPMEFEWEYAARGGRDGAPYPWGGPYIRNSKGCILANFKPGRGSYIEDGGLYTVRADAYWANDFGLYNMAGNVAEWTESQFTEVQNSFIHDLNPTINQNNADDLATGNRKVIRGGSWKDVGFMIQTGTRQYEYKDSSKSYIGFRNLLPFLGRSINDATN